MRNRTYYKASSRPDYRPFAHHSLPLWHSFKNQAPTTLTAGPVHHPASPYPIWMKSASCPICGITYTHHLALTEHRKRRRGQTHGPVCGQPFSMMSSVLRQMMARHGMAKEEVGRVTNRTEGWVLLNAVTRLASPSSRRRLKRRHCQMY